MDEIVWSIDKECKCLDRAGRGNSTKFWYITQKPLTDTVDWEMSNNTYIISAGKLWTRQGCISMGGSFSAQSADLHRLWSVCTIRHQFYRLGNLRVSDEGLVYWENPLGRVSLWQIRDNVLVASSYPDSPQTRLIETVCDILQQCWSLRVLCECATPTSNACTYSCHGTSVHAVGYSLVR